MRDDNNMEQIYLSYNPNGPASFRNGGPSLAVQNQVGAAGNGVTAMNGPRPKMPAYINRAPTQTGASYQEMASKMANLSVDQMKMMNRPANPGSMGDGPAGPSSPGFGANRFPNMNPAMAPGPGMYGGAHSPNFGRQGPPTFPSKPGGSAGVQGALGGAAGGGPPHSGPPPLHPRGPHHHHPHHPTSLPPPPHSPHHSHPPHGHPHRPAPHHPLSAAATASSAAVSGAAGGTITTAANSSSAANGAVKNHEAERQILEGLLRDMELRTNVSSTANRMSPPMGAGGPHRALAAQQQQQARLAPNNGAAGVAQHTSQAGSPLGAAVPPLNGGGVRHPSQPGGGAVPTPEGDLTLNPSSMASGSRMAGEASPTSNSNKVTVLCENGTTYFYNPEEAVQSHLTTGQVAGGSFLLPNWSAFSGTPANVSAARARASANGMLDSIRLEILNRQLVCHSAADADANPDLPSEVDNFTALCPLEPPSTSPMHKSTTFGYVTTVYKAVNIKTGQHVCLRRIHGYRLVNTKCMTLVEKWKTMAHANLVTLRQVFTSKSFGDHSMVFVYDYFPCAETVMAKHFSQPNQMNAALGDPFNGDANRPYSQAKNAMLRQHALNGAGLLPEAVIWNYIIQLTSALRYVHGGGLALRTLDPTKIMVQGQQRLLVNCCGIFDVLTFDPNSNNPMTAMTLYQQDDLVGLGRIVLAFACNNITATQRENLPHSLDIVSSNYSSDLRNLITYLLTTNQSRPKSVNDLMPMIGARFYTAIDACLQRNDFMEVELAKEMENGRIVRLLSKLCTIVDRAEFNLDSTWSETGDRYMLKLFRDYLFHQVTEDGRPFLDLSHITAHLNRLDAGIPDMITLMSRDEQNVLVVSYAELKNCLEQSFGELEAASKSKKHHNQLQ